MSDFITRYIGPGIGWDAQGQLWREINPDDPSDKRFTTCPDLRTVRCAICGNGWELNAKSYGDLTRCSPTESRSHPVHRTCFEAFLGYEELKMWSTLADELKLGPCDLLTTDNKYGGAWNTPWYEIKWRGKDLPKLLVGRRKRVWEVRLILDDLPGIPEAMERLETTFSGWAPTHQRLNATTYYFHSYEMRESLSGLKAALSQFNHSSQVLPGEEE